MDNYIALLLLVMPGFVARKIYKQTNDVREDLNTFEETMYCLLDSTAIMLFVFGIFSVFYSLFHVGEFSIRELSVYFDDMRFCVAYGFSAAFAAYILGVSSGEILETYNKEINMIRKNKGMAQIAISQDVLDEFLSSDGMQTKMADGTALPRLIEICKDGQMVARGWLKFTNMKHREFYLENCEAGVTGFLKKDKEKMPPIKKIYVDGRLGLIIREYDLTNFVDERR